MGLGSPASVFAVLLLPLVPPMVWGSGHPPPSIAGAATRDPKAVSAVSLSPPPAGGPPRHDGDAAALFSCGVSGRERQLAACW